MPKFDLTGKTTSRTQMFSFSWLAFELSDEQLRTDKISLSLSPKVDSSDRKRMGESTDEFNELLKDEKLRSVPILVLANKQDLTGALKSSEVAELIGLVKLKDRDWQIQACTAIDGSGLKEAMDWLCKCVKKQ